MLVTLRCWCTTGAFLRRDNNHSAGPTRGRANKGEKQKAEKPKCTQGESKCRSLAFWLQTPSLPNTTHTTQTTHTTHTTPHHTHTTRESCDHQFLTPLLKFFGYPDGVVTELFAGTLKLRYSSTPFSMRFPSWTVSPHPVVPVPFSGKSSVHKRELCSGDGLPTPKRWKRLVPPGTGHLGIKDDVPPFLFPRTGVG